MTSPNANAFRNPTKYTGQNYNFTPEYTRSRDPTTVDIKDPRNQGYYPYNSIWNNRTNGNIWILQKIVANVATWVQLSTSAGPMLQITGDTGIAIPSAGNVNLITDSNFHTLGGTGIITGTGSTVTLNLTQGLASPSPIGNTAPNTGAF